MCIVTVSLSISYYDVIVTIFTPVELFQHDKANMQQAQINIANPKLISMA